VKTSVEDIMHTFQLVDEGCFQDKIPTFCAVNKSHVPLLADEMSDLASIRLELSQLRQHVEELSSQLSTACRCKSSSVDTVSVKSTADHVHFVPTVADVLSNQSSGHQMRWLLAVSSMLLLLQVSQILVQLATILVAHHVYCLSLT